MSRPSRDSALIETAMVWSNRSTCSRLQVGAVVSYDGRILAQGYNGAPAGLPHCDHKCDCNASLTFERDERHEPSCASLRPCTVSVHAEANAIAFAAKEGVELNEAKLTSTHQPCLDCAKLIVNAGILAVDYLHPYRVPAGLELLQRAGVQVRRMVSGDSTPTPPRDMMGG